MPHLDIVNAYVNAEFLLTNSPLTLESLGRMFALIESFGYGITNLLLNKCSVLIVLDICETGTGTSLEPMPLSNYLEHITCLVNNMGKIRCFPNRIAYLEIPSWKIRVPLEVTFSVGIIRVFPHPLELRVQI